MRTLTPFHFTGLAAALLLPALRGPEARAQDATPPATPPARAEAATAGTARDAEASYSDATAMRAEPTGAGRAARARHVYNSVPVEGPYLAITFDDGPHATLTPKLLDLLAERKAKATFFVLGQLVEEYPDIARRIVREGHEIASHSWSHPSFTKIGLDGTRKQLRQTHDSITRVTGVAPTLVRPPYGATSAVLDRLYDTDFGYKSILWSVDPLDWKRPGPGVIADRLVNGASPGAILLAHDIHPGTIAAMPDTLDRLIARGYRLVTVSELLKMERPPAPKAQPAEKTAAAPGATPALAAAAPSPAAKAPGRRATRGSN